MAEEAGGPYAGFPLSKSTGSPTPAGFKIAQRSFSLQPLSPKHAASSPTSTHLSTGTRGNIVKLFADTAVVADSVDAEADGGVVGGAGGAAGIFGRAYPIHVDKNDIGPYPGGADDPVGSGADSFLASGELGDGAGSTGLNCKWHHRLFSWDKHVSHFCCHSIPWLGRHVSHAAPTHSAHKRLSSVTSSSPCDALNLGA